VHAYIAILRYDAGYLGRARLTRVWLALVAAPALFLVLVAGTQDELASETLAAYLGWVLLPLSIAVTAVLAGAAINGEAQVAADTMLSRAVTREAYLAAKMTARLGSIVLVYLLVTIPAAVLMVRYGVADTTVGGVILGLVAAGALLTLVATVSLTLSVFVDRVPLAVLGVVAALAGFVLASEVVGLRWLSPLELGRMLAAIFRGDVSAWRASQPALSYLLISGALVAGMFWRYRSRDL
jgi:hypothetical protein